MYLQKEVLPVFTKWVEAQKELVPMEDVKRYGQYFVANYVEPTLISSPGEVYDFFEKIATYKAIETELKEGVMSEQELMVSENMKNLSDGIYWAMEHDALDRIKYEPIKEWTKDISCLKGMSPEEM